MADATEARDPRGARPARRGCRSTSTSLSDDADLFQAGMSSHASVSVMLGLEDAFDVEFPDEMLKRSVFESVAAISAALRELAGGRAGMSVAVDSEQALARRVREIARDVAAVNADDVDRAGALPARDRSTRCASGRALAAFVPAALGGGGVSLATLAQCCLELGGTCAASAMVFAMHQIQVVSIVRHLDPGSWFETYLTEVATDGRLIASVTSEVGTGGDMGRSIAARDRRRRWPAAVREAGARRSATASTPTTC